MTTFFLGHSRCCIRSNQRGATMLEFVLVFPLLMAFVIAVLDISHYLTVESLLDEAVHRSLDKAISVSNLDVNPNGADPGSYEMQRQIMARQRSSDAGQQFLDNTKVIKTGPIGDGQTARTRLMTGTITESRVVGTPLTSTAGVIVLLPGECALIENGETECNRETLGTSATAPAPVQKPAHLMERHPIKVVAVATLDRYMPFLIPKTIKVKAFGYRHAVPQGPFPAWEDPQLLAEGPPVPLAGPEPPLPAPEMPDEEPLATCVVSWGRCLEETRKDSERRPFRPSNIPTPDGSCKCIAM